MYMESHEDHLLDALFQNNPIRGDILQEFENFLKLRRISSPTPIKNFSQRSPRFHTLSRSLSVAQKLNFSYFWYLPLCYKSVAVLSSRFFL